MRGCSVPRPLHDASLGPTAAVGRAPRDSSPAPVHPIGERPPAERSAPHPRLTVVRSPWRKVVLLALAVAVVPAALLASREAPTGERPVRAAVGAPERHAPPPSRPPSPSPSPAAVPPPPSAVPAAPAPSLSPAPSPAPPHAAGGPPAVLVRSVGALPPDVVPRLAALEPVTAVVEVGAGAALLRASRDAGGDPVGALDPGWGLPLDVIAVDPGPYAALLAESDRAAFLGLGPGRALLGATSARLRGLGTGTVLDVDGFSFVVTGVVDDRLVGAAELVVVTADGARVGADSVRYAVVQTDGPLAVLTAAVEAVVDGRPGVLATALGSAPWPVSWRDVLPQALVKERFGEFAIRPGEGRALTQQPGWTDAHLQTARVPILGEVRCHRMMLPALAAALAELEAAGLAALVDRGDYAGCHSPRLIAAGGPVSRHAWGLAVDLNAASNPFGAPSAQDPRLVEVMERHGFGFGGRWPVPDAMHFEYRGP